MRRVTKFLIGRTVLGRETAIRIDDITRVTEQEPARVEGSGSESVSYVIIHRRSHGTPIEMVGTIEDFAEVLETKCQ